MSGYRVQAHISRPSIHGGRVGHDVPSFVLETGVLGLVDRTHALLVAFTMLQELAGPDAAVSLTVADLADCAS